MAFTWDWWRKPGVGPEPSNLPTSDFNQPFIPVQRENETNKSFGVRTTISDLERLRKRGRLRLGTRIKTFGFKATAKWLFWDFASSITFGLIKAKPIVADNPARVENINQPTDNHDKKITKVDDPEEDEDATNKKYVDDKFTGKFTGSWTNQEGDTVTVVDGLITDVS